MKGKPWCPMSEHSRFQLAAALLLGMALGAQAPQSTPAPPPVPPQIRSFAAARSLVNLGEGVALHWKLGGGEPEQVLLDGQPVASPGEVLVFPHGRQTFTLEVRNVAGREVRTVQVTARGMEVLAGQVGGSGFADGMGTLARFRHPVAIAVDAKGQAYVADAENHTIRKISPEGLVSTLAGVPGHPGSQDGPAAQASFNHPEGVACDGAGNVYVSDTGNHIIRCISPKGKVSTLAGTPGQLGTNDGKGAEAHFNKPTGLALDAKGTLWISDTGNHTIRALDGKGRVTTSLGLSGQKGCQNGLAAMATFNEPRGLAFDTQGNLFIADRKNHVIRKRTPAGEVSTFAGDPERTRISDGPAASAGFNDPLSISFDPSGNMLVADSLTDSLRRISPAGEVMTMAGAWGHPGNQDGKGREARFDHPSGVAVDAQGRCWVADSENHVIRWVDAQGQVRTGAGLPRLKGSQDGQGTAARFFSPCGMARTSSGEILVADSGNHIIRKISKDGRVSTLAGIPEKWGSRDGRDPRPMFFSPRDLALGPDGQVLVADTYNSALRILEADGTVKTQAGRLYGDGRADGPGLEARFKRPSALVLDPEGNAYVADTENNAIRKVSPKGEVSTLPGFFTKPLGIARDAKGALYVTESSKSTIQKIALDGAVSLFAGQPGKAGFADGPASSAQFRYPWGILVDPAGNVLVADEGNHAVRKISPDGRVTTLLGHPGEAQTCPGPLPAWIDSPMRMLLTPEGDLLVSTLDGIVKVTAP